MLSVMKHLAAGLMALAVALGPVAACCCATLSAATADSSTTTALAAAPAEHACCTQKPAASDTARPGQPSPQPRKGCDCDRAQIVDKTDTAAVPTSTASTLLLPALALLPAYYLSPTDHDPAARSRHHTSTFVEHSGGGGTLRAQSCLLTV